MVKRKFVLFLLSAAAFFASDVQGGRQAVDCVNPLIGTPFAGFEDGLEGGGTMPCVNAPFAMTNFVPQTCQNRIGRMPYVYEDDKIIGFLATHQPTVWMGDYGYVSVMPQIGDLEVQQDRRALSFSHENEQSSPYRYSVEMQKAGKVIKGEIAAASRCALFRFTFPRSDKSHLVIQAINAEKDKPFKGYVNISPDKKEIVGYNPDQKCSHLVRTLKNFKGWFVIQFDKPFETYGTWTEGQINEGSAEERGSCMGAYITFPTSEKEQVNARIATSFISLEQARQNLENEVPHWNFDKLSQSTRKLWQDNLSRIEVGGVSEEQKEIFYTAMFHTMLFPREFSEYGRYYSAFDDKIHKGVSYNDFSLWDTFRAVHPLFHFIQPERVNPMIQSLVQMYEQGGWIPKWPNPTYTNIMIGTHADSVIADAYIKGFRSYDVHKAYQAIRKNAFQPPDCDTKRGWGDREEIPHYEARGGSSYYNSLGYVPFDRTQESVSRTVEFSYGDFCAAQMAGELGKNDEYRRLMRRSSNYKNLYNPETGFLAPRLFNGEWAGHPNWGFTEGSPWTYRFGAMHDIEGMIEMMGGDEKFAALLTKNFEDGHYRHDNEPGHHYIYLFNYCGKPWKTQQLVRKHTSEENYRNVPLGINGNDDCGQMSAWYIFSVMGFYPVSPGTDHFTFGAPQFPRFKLHLTHNGRPKTFEIIARNLSDENKYVRSITLDGKTINKPYITYSQIMNSRRLVFEMTDSHGYKNR
ncbi:GH92 family glycosyl hydrolase [Sedimentisphaera salicampi]|uniref:Putative alpha-1,2-mannosidase n=1 Tax=Sedimentisphaera salicampi TaxID=1941349 RepID=A0A1W6LK57_9BACT|nr:GH92 family glycosyl hydrolase [Sedimentisphaera salicampi]ARN56149.1 putative alpha-1,2-mannosidase [Sedimentisphaera salicampi]ARN57309.1 putative alpha-1,2-mannosidase [Sedimentisphaera salicampi]